jgi:dihydrofolate reductase
MLSIILSVAENGTIGAEGKLPWHLPADLRYFRELTFGHPVIMGRRTFESIGRPLDGRTNIVITSQNIAIAGTIVTHNLEEAVRAARAEAGSPEIFMIGGARVFAEALPLADRLYITYVKGAFVGDAFCPRIDPGKWRTVSRRTKDADAKNDHAMEFVVYEKVA